MWQYHSQGILQVNSVRTLLAFAGAGRILGSVKSLAVALGLWVGVGGAVGLAQVRDLDGRPVDPLERAADVKAVVLVFTSIECPISNRYAPDIRRLYEKFAADGVRFWLIFANPADSPEAVRAHVKAFGYPTRVLRDPRQDLVRLTQVTVTPEAAVFDRRGAIVYRGRIDDRYADLGIDRQTPTSRDLDEAIAATLAGRPVPNPITRAVGCFIPDVVR